MFLDKVDITSDGKWLLTIDGDGDAFVYHFNESTRIFDLFQEVVVNGVTSETGKISDDHLWLYLPKDDGIFYILKFNGIEYVLAQTLTDVTGLTWYIETTPDNFVLVFSVVTNYVYVYIYYGGLYVQLQKITYSTFQWRTVDISDDYWYLTVAEKGDNSVHVYKFNGTQFVEMNNNGTIAYPSYAWYSSFTSVTWKLVVTVNGTTYIYNNIIGDNAQLEQQIDGEYYHLITNDEKYMINFYNQTMYVYLNDFYIPCDIDYCMKCNDENCTLCSEVIGYYINETDGECGRCIVDNCLKCNYTIDVC